MMGYLMLLFLLVVLLPLLLVVLLLLLLLLLIANCYYYCTCLCCCWYCRLCRRLCVFLLFLYSSSTFTFPLRFYHAPVTFPRRPPPPRSSLDARDPLFSRCHLQ